MGIVEFTVQASVIAIPGALSPTDHGGPLVSFIAGGGANQQTAGKYLATGATAVGMEPS